MLFSWTARNQGNSFLQTITIESTLWLLLIPGSKWSQNTLHSSTEPIRLGRKQSLKASPHRWLSPARSGPQGTTRVSVSQRTTASPAAHSAISRTMLTAGPGNLQGERNLSGYEPLEKKFTEGFISSSLFPARPFLEWNLAIIIAHVFKVQTKFCELRDTLTITYILISTYPFLKIQT